MPSSAPTAEATGEANMVTSFIHFLREKMTAQSNPEILHSLEVAILSLENAFGLTDASYLFQPARPLLEVFTAAEGELQGEAQPRDPIAEANKLKEEGNQLMKENHYNEAIEKYTKAIKLHKDPVYFCNRAAAYCRIDFHSLAIQDCRTALSLDPNYSKAYGRMGLALSCQNRYGDAVNAYRKAIDLDPSQESYKNNLKIAEEKLNEERRATPAQDRGSTNPVIDPNFASMMNSPQMMEMASSLMNNPNIHEMMSQMMHNGGLFDMGLQLAAEMRNTNPDLVENLRRQFERHNNDENDQNPPHNG